MDDQPSALGTPTSRFVMADGLRLHYLEQGHGAPVIYFHGAGGMAIELFAGPLGALLARWHRVIAFDRPGYGASERGPRTVGPRAQAALFNQVLRQLEIARPIVIGHSWGAALALAMAVADAKVARGLVLIAGWCFPANHTTVRLMALAYAPLLGTLMTAPLTPSLGRQLAEGLVERIFAPNPVPAGFAEFPIELATRPNHLAANKDDLDALNRDVALLEPAYPGLAVPVEIVVGMKDRIVEPARHGLRLAKTVPRAHITRLPLYGHMPHHFEPETVERAVERLMRGD